MRTWHLLAVALLAGGCDRPAAGKPNCAELDGLTVCAASAKREGKRLFVTVELRARRDTEVIGLGLDLDAAGTRIHQDPDAMERSRGRGMCGLADALQVKKGEILECDAVFTAPKDAAPRLVARYKGGEGAMTIGP